MAREYVAPLSAVVRAVDAEVRCGAGRAPVERLAVARRGAASEACRPDARGSGRAAESAGLACHRAVLAARRAGVGVARDEDARVARRLRPGPAAGEEGAGTRALRPA